MAKHSHNHECQRCLGRNRDHHQFRCLERHRRGHRHEPQPHNHQPICQTGCRHAGYGIPDSGKLAIGADILISDATEVNPNPDAHGLDNMQVYQNQSVLLADNYSTENDGISDWWLVQYG